MSRQRLGWDKAPHWAKVLLKHVEERDTYVFASSFKDDAIAWPRAYSELGTFTLSKAAWVLIENRPISDKPENKPEESGGSCDYYRIPIDKPWTAKEAYVAECGDIMDKLEMTYAESNMFKEIWRSAAARTLGKIKAGHSEQRGAEKIEFFAKRNSIQKGVKQ